MCQKDSPFSYFILSKTRFQADGRKIVKVGVNFDDTIRSISEWIVEFE